MRYQSFSTTCPNCGHGLTATIEAAPKPSPPMVKYLGGGLPIGLALRQVAQKPDVRYARRTHSPTGYRVFLGIEGTWLELYNSFGGRATFTREDTDSSDWEVWENE